VSQAASHPNLLLVTIDALRADRVHAANCITPHLDRLAARSASFSDAISVGPYTAPAFLGIFSSNYPSTFLHEVQDPTERSPQHTFSTLRPSFVDVLKEQGYSTAGFVDCNPFLSSTHGYGRAFDTFQNLPPPGKVCSRVVAQHLERSRSFLRRHETLHCAYRAMRHYVLRKAPTRGAAHLNAQAISWLKQQDSRFFLWIHYMDTHEPYVPPRSRARTYCWAATRFRYCGRELRDVPHSCLGLLVELYDAAVAYVDSSVAALLREIGALGLLHNTFVVITADHGEEFGEHGGWARHHSKLYRELLHVPLIVSGPGIAPVTVTTQISLIDLAPTVLDLAGIKPDNRFQGRSLLPFLNGRERHIPVISECLSQSHLRVSCRYAQYSYIATFEHPGGELVGEELYHQEQDPSEKHDLKHRDAKVEELRSATMAHVRRQRQLAGGERQRLREQAAKLRHTP
jgi:arylsulfatase A-like enzyme